MITEGFDPSICAPTLGGFSVRFNAGTESKLLGPHVAPNPPTHFGGRTENWKHDTICFTPTRLSNPTAANVLASSLFSGRCDRFSMGAMGEPWDLSGPSILAWLGTADNPGIGPLAGSSYTAGAPYTGSLADWLLAVLVANDNNGLTLDATAVTANALNCAINGNDILRHAMNQLVVRADAEYTCHPSGTVEFQDGDDAAGTVFTWTPTVIFGEGIQSGREQGMVAFQAEVTASFDYTNEGRSAHVRNSDGTAGFVASEVRVSRSFGGSANVELRKFYGADDDLFDQNPTSFYSATDLCRSDQFTCQVDAPLIRRDCKPGDWVYLVSERLGIINASNVVNFGGRTLPPQKRKLTGLSYPVTEGMGVYVIHDSTQYRSGAVQDVTEDVIFETGTTRVSLDTTAPKSLRRAVLGTQHRPTWRKA